MRRFAQENKEHTLCVVITGKNHQTGTEWAEGVAAALTDRSGTSIALVIYSSHDQTPEHISQAVSDHDHARLCMIALDEGVAAALAYMGEMSAGVTEEFVACFREADMYEDGAYHLLMNAESKINSFTVVKCGNIDDDGVASQLSKNVLTFDDDKDIAGFGNACGNAVPELTD